ncbi:glycosyltransferase [uncultured Desulfuromonas sp.]|uniref:glycosyltransferase n=1 Tax=uncultured Desulfuromonas sp. TaxID=181013 RepID=UPI002AAA7EDE|nr:glycosyltransferase [uncultured Desulfuromonas sp.]
MTTFAICCEIKPFVSVIIPVYRDWDRLKLCIDALKKQTYPSDKFEVIIVNNGFDAPPSDLSLSDNFCLIQELKRGSYAARNAGVGIAKGDILAFTDSDCIPDISWLANGVHVFNKGNTRIAGKIELFYAEPRLTFAEIYEKAFAFPQQRYASELHFGATANMLSCRSIFDAVGLFDPDLYSGGDCDWGKRAYNAGYLVQYSDCVLVRHPARKTFSELLNKNKRVIGGVFDRKMGIAKFLYDVFLSISPPIVIAREIFHNDELTLYEKIIAIAMSYCIKMVLLKEKIRLYMCSGEPRNT